MKVVTGGFGWKIPPVKELMGAFWAYKSQTSDHPPNSYMVGEVLVKYTWRNYRRPNRLDDPGGLERENSSREEITGWKIAPVKAVTGGFGWKIPPVNELMGAFWALKSQTSDTPPNSRVYRRRPR